MKEIIKREVSKAIEVMRDGGVILYPTDTIWGIGCDATNEAAVRRVYEIKHRVDSKALITLVDSDARLQRYVRNVPNVAWDLLELATRPVDVDIGRRLRPGTQSARRRRQRGTAHHARGIQP
jgi:L-threonylcarbamoyladenylate synthase